MVALVGAMFVSVGPALAADEEVGDLNSNSGVCQLIADSAGTFGEEDYVAARYGLRYDSNGDDTVNTSDGEVGTWVTDTNPDTDGNQPGYSPISTSLCAPAPDGDDADSEPDAAANLNRNFKITPNGTASPIVELLSPTVTISLSDSDGIVADDTSLTVTIRTSHFNGYGNDNENPQLTLEYVRVSGELDAPAGAPAVDADGVFLTGAGGAVTPVSPGASRTSTTQDGMWVGTITIPDGTTAREYTVSTRVSYENDADADNAPKRVGQSKSFTVGDAGTNAASASLSLGNASEDNTLRVGDQTIPEDGSEPASGGDVWLRLYATNSLGAPANASDLSSVTVIAPGAILTIHDARWDGDLGGLVPGMANDANGETAGNGDATGSNSASTSNIGGFGHTTFIKVEKAGTPPKPGSVDVYAIVIGKDGGPQSETVTVSFTGAGATLELGDAKPVAPGNKTEFTMNALDSGGSNASVNQASFKVTNAEGKRAEGKVDVVLGTVGKSTATTLDDNPRAKAGIVTVANTAAAGVYTVEASLPGVAGSSSTTEVIVAGTANSVELAADPDSGDAAEQAVIKVTATVTDKNGANVADGTRVEFTVLGSNLSAIGPGHSAIETSIQKTLNSDDEVVELSVTSGGVKTKDGEASVNFVATGAGTAVVSATTEGGSASGVLRVSTTDSAAEEPEAMPEEEASLSCLSSLSGFSTWTCDVGASASEIFDWISSRGATALHLNSNRMWVRYSVVDGAMVPGSSDFMVTKSDILYISN